MIEARPCDWRIAVSYLTEYGCTDIFVFGSAATGEHDEQSDLDITVRGIAPSEFFEVYGELMMRPSRPVDLVDLDIQENFGRSLLALGTLKRIA